VGEYRPFTNAFLDAAIGILRASRLSHREGVTSSEVSDLFYSVIWATSDTESDDSIDIAANEELWLTTLGSLPLSVYRDRLKENPMDTEAVLGCMRCHDTNGEWKEVMALMHSYHEAWSANETEWNLDHQQQKDRKRATRLAARASWQLGDWSQLEQFASLLREDTTTPAGGLPLNFDTAFLNAVLQIHDKSWDLARFSIDAARRAMDQRLTALMAESYGRAYPSLVVRIYIFLRRESYRLVDGPNFSGNGRNNTTSTEEGPFFKRPGCCF